MKKKKILIVDDEVSSTRLLKLNLEQTDEYEVRIENWPEDALKAAREFEPDLIFLDVMMPRIFGGDVARIIKADNRFEKTPIVFLSATVGKERAKEHGDTLGGYPFLAKPVSIDEVISCIEQQLNGTKTME